MFNKLTVYQLVKVFKYFTDADYINFLNTCKKFNKTHCQLKYLVNEYNYVNIMKHTNKYLFRQLYINNPVDSIVIVHNSRLKTLNINIPETVISLRLGVFVGKVKNVSNIRYLQLGNYYTDIDFVNNLSNLPNIVNIACEMVANIILSPLIIYNKYCHDKRIKNNVYYGFNTMKKMGVHLLENINNKNLIFKFMETCFLKNIRVTTIINEIRVLRKKESKLVTEKILEYVISKVDTITKNKQVTFSHCDVHIIGNLNGRKNNTQTLH